MVNKQVKQAKQARQESRAETHASVKKEMAQPRMARSARIAEQKLDIERTAEQSSATMPGTVEKLIPPTRGGKPEKAQIAVHGAERPYRKLRIENSLTDENGDDVKLEKGTHVEVTVAADAKV